MKILHVLAKISTAAWYPSPMSHDGQNSLGTAMGNGRTEIQELITWWLWQVLYEHMGYRGTGDHPLILEELLRADWRTSFGDYCRAELHILLKEEVNCLASNTDGLLQYKWSLDSFRLIELKASPKKRENGYCSYSLYTRKPLRLQIWLHSMFAVSSNAILFNFWCKSSEAILEIWLQRLAGASLLVFANKKDIQGASKPAEIAKVKCISIMYFSWHISWLGFRRDLGVAWSMLWPGTPWYVFRL